MRDQLRVPPGSEKKKIQAAVSCVLPILTWGLGSLSLLQAEREAIDAAWCSQLSLITRNCTATGLPHVVRSVLHRCSIDERFVSTDATRFTPSPSYRCLKSKVSVAAKLTS